MASQSSFLCGPDTPCPDHLTFPEDVVRHLEYAYQFLELMHEGQKKKYSKILVAWKCPNRGFSQERGFRGKLIKRFDQTFSLFNKFFEVYDRALKILDTRVEKKFCSKTLIELSRDVCAEVQIPERWINDGGVSGIESGKTRIV